LVAEWIVSVSDSRSAGWARNCELYAAAHWLPRWSALSDITGPAVRRYIGERLRAPGTKGRRLSASTLHKELTALRRLLVWCGVDPPKWESPTPRTDFEPFALSPERAEAILAALPDRHSHRLRRPAREWFTVAWACGFRPGTLSKLTWDDVDLETGLVTIVAGKDKRRYRRVIPLTGEAVEVLRSMRSELPPSASGPIFGEHDHRVSLRRAARDAGLADEDVARLTHYSFRHGRLSQFAAVSQDLAALQLVAGHRTLQTTQRYLHSTVDRAQRLLEAADSGRILAASSAAAPESTRK
jgi:integrase